MDLHHSQNFENKMPRFYALRCKLLCDTGHETTFVLQGITLVSCPRIRNKRLVQRCGQCLKINLFRFDALGCKLLCNTGHKSSPNLKGIAFILCPRMETKV